VEVEDVRWQFYSRVAEHEAGRAFIESCVRLGKSPKTIDAYARGLEDYFRSRPLATNEQLVEADAEQFEIYLAHLRSRPPARARSAVRHLSGATLADSTIYLRVVALRLFFDFCIERHWRANRNNPVPRGQFGINPKRGPATRKERLPWIPQPPQWHALLRELFLTESPRNQALIVLMYTAALRRQEVVGLRLDDLDWVAGTVTVRAEHSKSGKERRIPISAACERLLRHYVQTDRMLILAGFPGENAGPLFLSESPRNTGVGLKIGAVNDIVTRLRTHAGLPLLHPHTLRHLRCTVLRRGGLSRDDVAIIAGHSDTRVTALYDHLAPVELAANIASATAKFDMFMVRKIAERTHGD
jgi:integrase/recombinase XerD